MNCPNCGNEIGKNQKFCTKCGYKKVSDEEQKIKIDSEKMQITLDGFKYFTGGVIAVLIFIAIILAPFINSAIKGAFWKQKFNNFEKDYKSLITTINNSLSNNTSTNPQEVFKILKNSLAIKEDLPNNNKIILQNSELELSYTIRHRACTPMNYDGKFGAQHCVTLSVIPSQKDKDYKDMNISRQLFIYTDGTK